MQDLKLKEMLSDLISKIENVERNLLVGQHWKLQTVDFRKSGIPLLKSVAMAVLSVFASVFRVSFLHFCNYF
jgi:hypothetical protein